MALDIYAPAGDNLAPGEARCPGPSPQDVLDQDGDTPPAALRAEAYEYLGNEDLSLERYTSQAFYDLEVERIINRNWILAGHQSELPEPGDFKVINVGKESAIIVRGSDGELKAFAIASAKRSKHFPDMPTLKELGVDMIYALDRGIVAPKGTDKQIIEYWAQAFKQAAEDKDLLAQMDAKGTDVEWVGPDGYRAWADKAYADHENVAVKIGMWKK